VSILLDCPKITTRSTSIDALRAGLALFVMLDHLLPWTDGIEGAGTVPRPLLLLTQIIGTLTQSSFELNPAVIAFIVLSGYCIHRAGFRTDESGLSVYGVRRAFRILPIFYFAFFLSALVGAFETQHPSFGCVAAHAMMLSTLTPHFANCPLGNLPLGTVKVEIVLYGLYAFAFWMVWRGREALVWITVALIAVVALSVAAHARDHFALYYWWQNWSALGFFSYWWIGAAFVNPAVAAHARARLRFLLGCYAVLTLAILLVTPVALTLQSYGVGDVPTIAFVLAELRKFVLAALVGVLIVRLEGIALSSWNPLAALGRASYSLYALHPPLIFVLCKLGSPWYLTIAANIAIAFVSYATIENPGIAIGRLYLRRHAMPSQPAPVVTRS
jgi:peptidoglycan/LPS O-acetylase OafA/YrhL